MGNTIGFASFCPTRLTIASASHPPKATYNTPMKNTDWAICSHTCSHAATSKSRLPGAEHTYQYNGETISVSALPIQLAGSTNWKTHVQSREKHKNCTNSCPGFRMLGKTAWYSPDDARRPAQPADWEKWGLAVAISTREKKTNDNVPERWKRAADEFFSPPKMSPAVRVFSTQFPSHPSRSHRSEKQDTSHQSVAQGSSNQPETRDSFRQPEARSSRQMLEPSPVFRASPSWLPLPLAPMRRMQPTLLPEELISNLRPRELSLTADEEPHIPRTRSPTDDWAFPWKEVSQEGLKDPIQVLWLECPPHVRSFSKAKDATYFIRWSVDVGVLRKLKEQLPGHVFATDSRGREITGNKKYLDGQNGTVYNALIEEWVCFLILTLRGFTA